MIRQIIFDYDGVFTNDDYTAVSQVLSESSGIPKNKMDPRRTCESLNMFEILAHAHYLCDGVKEFAGNPRKQRKMGSHLAAVQMFLSFAGWYTLQELMDHNRPLEG